MVGVSKKEANTLFTKRLKQLIGKKKNAEFERNCGLSANSINRYLDGNLPKLDVLEKISNSTKCPIEWLINGKTTDYNFLFTLYFPEALNVNKDILNDRQFTAYYMTPISTSISHHDDEYLDRVFEVNDLSVYTVSAAIRALMIGGDDPFHIYLQRIGASKSGSFFTEHFAEDVKKSLKAYKLTKTFVSDVERRLRKIEEEILPTVVHYSLAHNDNELPQLPKALTEEGAEATEYKNYILEQQKQYKEILKKNTELEIENKKLKIEIEYQNKKLELYK